MDEQEPRLRFRLSFLLTGSLLLVAALLLVLRFLPREPSAALDYPSPPMDGRDLEGDGEDRVELRPAAVADSRGETPPVEGKPRPPVATYEAEPPIPIVPAAQAQAPPGIDPTSITRIEVRGHVVDARDRSGIAGAEVFLNAPVRMTTEARFAVTDDQGTFSLGEATLRELGTITIKARGYQLGVWFGHVYAAEFGLPQVEHVGRDEFGVCFPLVRGARVHGTVVDESGMPVRQGQVIAYPSGMIDHLDLDTGDRISRALFFHDGVAGILAPNQASWFILCRPFAPLDGDGKFDLACLPANEEMSLLVLACDVNREILDTITLHEGDEEERILIARRFSCIPGVLIPPEGMSADAFGLWACAHPEAKCLAGSRLNPGRDLWIPVQRDGSFLAGPLDPEEPVVLRVSHSTPVIAHHAEFFSAATLMLQPGDTAGKVLEVDLRRAAPFRLEDR